MRSVAAQLLAARAAPCPPASRLPSPAPARSAFYNQDPREVHEHKLTVLMSAQVREQLMAALAEQLAAAGLAATFIHGPAPSEPPPAASPPAAPAALHAAAQPSCKPRARAAASGPPCTTWPRGLGPQHRAHPGLLRPPPTHLTARCPPLQASAASSWTWCPGRQARAPPSSTCAGASTGQRSTQWPPATRPTTCSCSRRQPT